MGTTGQKITTTSKSRATPGVDWRGPGFRKGWKAHALVAEHIPADWADLPVEEIANRVVIGIESDRGPRVTALRAAGYRVFVINPDVGGPVLSNGHWQRDDRPESYDDGDWVCTSATVCGRTRASHRVPPTPAGTSCTGTPTLSPTHSMSADGKMPVPMNSDSRDR